MEQKTTIFLNKSEAVDKYKILTSLITPRPIAWISTVSVDGRTNIAPFSFFNVFGSKPPIAIINQGNKSTGEMKDTPRNIKDTGEFVINIVDESLAEKMNLSCAAYPDKISEIDDLNIPTSRASEVKAPLVSNSPANLECKLIEIRNYGENRLIVGEIICVHIRESLWNEETKHISSNYQPLGKLHGNMYSTTRQRLEIERPQNH